MPSVFTDGITILYCSSPPPATKKEETITIAKQCKAEPCHKPSLSKEGLGGL